MPILFHTNRSLIITKSNLCANNIHSIVGILKKKLFGDTNEYKKDMNPIGLISEFTAATAPGPIAITPDLFGGPPRAATATHLAQHTQALPAHPHHAFASEHHQTILDHYGALVNGNRSRISVGIANTSDDHTEHVQHFDIGVGSDSASIHQQYDDDTEDNEDMVDACAGDDNSMDMADQYEDDDGDDETDGNGTSCDASDTTNGNILNYQSFAAAALQASGGPARRLPHKKKTKSTQTNRKIKPVKRPGLVLKTPIAYQPCLDPSVIPIQRDGMGTFVLFILFRFYIILFFR